MKLRQVRVVLPPILVVLVAAVFLVGCQLPGQTKKAGLQIITGDTPASLFLDGQYLEKSPFVDKSLQPGEYALRIEPDDNSLLPHDMTVNLRPGLMTVITWRPGSRPELSAGVVYELESLSGQESELQFLSIPDGAIVNIANQPKHFTPFSLTLDPGEYEFEVSLPSYQTQKHTVKLAEGHRTSVSVTLAKAGSPPPLPSVSPSASASAEVGARLASASAQLSAIATGSPSATTTSPEITGPRVRILPTNYRVGGVEGMRVRREPQTGAAELGFAATGSEYAYLNDSQNGWYKITFQNQVGWVSGQYSQLIQP